MAVTLIVAQLLGAEKTEDSLYCFTGCIRGRAS